MIGEQEVISKDPIVQIENTNDIDEIQYQEIEIRLKESIEKAEATLAELKSTTVPDMKLSGRFSETIEQVINSYQVMKEVNIKKSELIKNLRDKIKNLEAIHKEIEETREHIKEILPKEDVVKPVEEVAKVVEDVVKPVEEVAKVVEDVVKPVEEEIVVKDVVKPVVKEEIEVAKAVEDVAKVTEDVAKPGFLGKIFGGKQQGGNYHQKYYISYN